DPYAPMTIVVGHVEAPQRGFPDDTGLHARGLGPTLSHSDVTDNFMRQLQRPEREIVAGQYLPVLTSDATARPGDTAAKSIIEAPLHRPIALHYRGPRISTVQFEVARDAVK